MISHHYLLGEFRASLQHNSSEGMILRCVLPLEVYRSDKTETQSSLLMEQVIAPTLLSSNSFSCCPDQAWMFETRKFS